MEPEEGLLEKGLEVVDMEMKVEESDMKEAQLDGETSESKMMHSRESRIEIYNALSAWKGLWKG